MHSRGTIAVLNPFNGHLEPKGFSSRKALAALGRFGARGARTLRHGSAPAAIVQAPGCENAAEILQDRAQMPLGQGGPVSVLLYFARQEC